MERLSREEVKDLTDWEVRLACERIERDYSFGLLSDRFNSRENTIILKEEMLRRGGSIDN